MDNLISIVVPVYNVESYLRKCIESILNQTYKNLQIILVDDGSTDNSGNICDEYATKDSRIQVIHKENGGLVSARKAGLKLSSGEYFATVDSDDWIEPNMYEEMLKHLIQTNADFVNTGVIVEKREGTIINCKFETRIVNCPINDIDIWKMFMQVHKKFLIMPFIFSNLFKRELISYCYENIPNDINFGEDRISLTECLLRCKRVSFLKKAYYHYNHLRIGSYTSTMGAQRMIWIAKMFEQVRNLFYKYDIYDHVKNYWEISLSKYMLMQLYNTNFVIQNLFGHIDELVGKKIIIYGAGKVGYNYYNQISKTINCNIVDWVDKNFANYKYTERKVNPISNIKNNNYDVIVIAVKYKEVANQIIDELIAMNVDRNKLCWYEPIQSYYIN